jgi:hypothetical protein
MTSPTPHHPADPGGLAGRRRAGGLHSVAAGPALSTVTNMETKHAPRTPDDSPFFWMGVFLIGVTAAYVGDLIDVTEYTARFLVWVAGLW